VGVPRPAEPVKLLACVLLGEPAPLEESLHAMEDLWGPIDHRGPPRPFAGTDYYRPEMGSGLRRTLVSFSALVLPEAIVEAKLQANRIEEELRGPAGRRVNLDPGYLDLHKLVLASVKYGPLKVHLGRGVYADLVSRYFEGRFEPLPWTFQDFRESLYDEELSAIRALYKAALRAPP
jgi:hypothetical protein